MNNPMYSLKLVKNRKPIQVRYAERDKPILENCLEYNQTLFKELDAVIGYAPLTKEAMKITLNKLILSMNKTKLASKRAFFEECLKLI